MAAPVVNTVVKNAPDLENNWVEGTDWGWANAGMNTTSTSWADCSGSTSDSVDNGQFNLPAGDLYIVNRGSLDCSHNAKTAYVQVFHDGLYATDSSYYHSTTTLTYHSKQTYGSKYKYSLQDDDLGATNTISTAVSVGKFQGRSQYAGYTSYINNSISWFLKSKADTLMANKISCCNKSRTDGKNTGKMYVDSFTFICHGEGYLLSSGLYRYNDNAKYFPTHQVKNLISSLEYTTGGTSLVDGDYAIFIEGVFLEMT